MVQNVGMSADTAVTVDARRIVWEQRTSSLLAVLGVLFLVAYSVVVLVPDRVEWLTVALGAVLTTTWVAFGIDMIARVVLTDPGRRGKFVLTHPVDVLAIFVPLFRMLRIASLLRHIPFFRSRSGSAVRGSVIVYALVYALVFIYVIALATLQAERTAPGATITTFVDALWWAVVTITTVGYGDTYPVTGVGRVFAVILMGGGLVIIGTTSAIVVSVITERIATNRQPGQTADDQ